MLRWFHALMPKEERFFDLFARHSEAVVAGAVALRAMLEGGDGIAGNYQVVMDREHDADNVTREVLIAVPVGGVRIDIAHDQNAPVEGYNFTVRATSSGILGQSDEVLAALGALQLQFAGLLLVGQVHHHAAAGTSGDHVGLPALAARGGFGTGPVGFLLVGGVTPAADEFLGLVP